MRKLLHVMPVKVSKSRKKQVKSFLKELSFKDTCIDILDFDNGPTDLEYYTRKKWIPKMSDNALIYGYNRKIASWASLDMTAENFQTSREEKL